MFIEIDTSNDKMTEWIFVKHLKCFSIDQKKKFFREGRIYYAKVSLGINIIQPFNNWVNDGNACLAVTNYSGTVGCLHFKHKMPS